MMTQRGRELLAAADPWGCECGGLGDFGDDLLKAAGATGIGTDVQSVGTGAGTALDAIQAGDFNGVVEGGSQALDAAKGITKAVYAGWGDAKKFFASLGGTVEVPSFGYRMQPGKPNTIPPILTMARVTTLDHPNVVRKSVYTPAGFMQAVAAGYTFPNQDWNRFGLKDPIAPPSQALMNLFMTQRLVWNPFKKVWQGPTPGQTITPQSEVPKSPTGAVLSGAAVKENDQAWVNAMGATATGFEMQLRWVRDEYKAGRWKKAINGTPLGGKGILKMGANGLDGILGKPFPWVTRAIAEGLTFTTGPLAGQSFKSARVTWIRQLARLLKAQPQSQRPSNIGFLVTATDTGLSEGRPILGSGALGGGGGKLGGGAVVAAGAGLGLLWFLLA